MTAPDKVPLEAAFKGILSVCPLKGDVEEAPTVIDTLLFISDKFGDVIKPNLEKVIGLMIDGLIH
jgi:hypothetical protein